MLSVTRLTNDKKGSIKNVAQYMKATEYYDAAKGIGQADWLGSGLQGQEFKDDEKAFENLLKGYTPNGKKKLVQNAGKQNRRMGWDLTFSADKTVSIAYAAADSETQARILEAHKKATETALEFMSKEIRCRSGKDGTRIQPENLILRRVNHLDSRDGDPQLHSHIVLINAAQCEDGKWRTIDELEMFQAKHAAGAIYRNQLAQELKKIGFGIDSQVEKDVDGRPTGQIWHRIAGMDPKLLKQFSKRRAAIEQAMAEKGISAQQAAMRTRRGKEDVDPRQIIESARKAIGELHNQKLNPWSKADELLGLPSQTTELDLEQILSELHKTESAFNRYKFIDAVSKRHLCSNPAAAADDLLNELKQSGFIRELKPDKDGLPRFCSRQQWQLEQDVITSALKRKDDKACFVDKSTVAQAIEQHEKAQGFRFTDEQRKAVEFVTTESGAVACLTGQAGTGKTATAGAYIKAFEATGCRVLGASTAKRAADKLEEETGMASFSCAKLLNDLDNGKQKLDEKTVVVVDEAGMVGAKTLRQIQRYADEAGSKIVLLGDALQLQPVEAGNPFKELTRDLGEAKLSEIRRQKQEADREIAQAFYNGESGKTIVEQWEKRNQIGWLEDRQQAALALVEAYLQDLNQPDEKLILAGTCAECDHINNTLREKLKQQGQLSQPRTLEISGKLMGETRQMEICQGDRLVFKKNDKRAGVNNGEVATVLAVVDDPKKGPTLVLEKEDGERKTLAVKDYDRFDYAYANTVHAAQGQGKKSIYWLATPNRNLTRNMGLVAFTRTKESFKAFGAKQDKGKLIEKLDAWGNKETAQELSDKTKTKTVNLIDKLAQIGRNEIDKRMGKLQSLMRISERNRMLGRKRYQTSSREFESTVIREPQRKNENKISPQRRRHRGWSR